jgi:hypothetical protein
MLVTPLMIDKNLQISASGIDTASPLGNSITEDDTQNTCLEVLNAFTQEFILPH